MKMNYDKAIFLRANQYNTSLEDVRLSCADAEKLGISTIIVMPSSIPAAKIDNRKVKVAAACSYPFGCYPIESKVFEIKDAIKRGADEIYLVTTTGYIRDGNYDALRSELTAAVDACGATLLHVMVEIGALNYDQITKTCKLIAECGIKSIVTSAGFPFNSLFSVEDEMKDVQYLHTTTPKQVELVRSNVGTDIEVIACSSSMTPEESSALLCAGADKWCATI